MPSALPWRLPLIAATAVAFACADVEGGAPSDHAEAVGMGGANGSLAAAPTERFVALQDGVRALVEDGAANEAPLLAFARTEDREQPVQARLSLGDALRAPDRRAPYGYVDAAFARGTQLELLYRRYEFSFDYRDSREVAGVLVIDAADPSAPRVLGKHEWHLSTAEGASYQWLHTHDGLGDRRFARIDGRLVVLEQSPQWTGEGAPTLPRSRLRLVDLSRPEAITSATLTLAPHAYTGLFTAGAELWLGYLELGSDRAQGERPYVQLITFDASGAARLGTAVHMDIDERSLGEER